MAKTMATIWTIADAAALVLILLMTLLTRNFQSVTNLCLVLTVIFLVKAVVQDLWFGKVKGNRTVPLTVFNLVIDFARVIVFFATISDCAVDLLLSAGLGHLGNMLSFVAVLLIGGALFIFGEIASLQHGMEEEVVIHGKKIGWAVDVGACIVLVLVCALWWL